MASHDFLPSPVHAYTCSRQQRPDQSAWARSVSGASLFTHTSLDVCLNAAGYVHCWVALLFAQAESHDRCADSFEISLVTDHSI